MAHFLKSSALFTVLTFSKSSLRSAKLSKHLYLVVTRTEHRDQIKEFHIEEVFRRHFFMDVFIGFKCMR